MNKCAKWYCIAVGCRNNNKNSDHTFFRLPSGQTDGNNQRYLEWLTLIGREDLLQKKDLKKRSYSVCSAHFDISSMNIIRTLKANAVPTLLLANQHQQQEGPSGSTAETILTQFKDDEILVSKSIDSDTSRSKIQTTTKKINKKGEDKMFTKRSLSKNTGTQTTKEKSLEKSTQTSVLLSDGTSRKRKLSDELKKCKSEKSSLNHEIMKIKQEVEVEFLIE